MTFMHTTGVTRLIVFGHTPPGTSGHCYRGFTINEVHRLGKLRELVQSLEGDTLRCVSPEDFEIVRQALATYTSRSGYPADWYISLFNDAESAHAFGRVLEGLLMNGCMQGWILRSVISISCASDHRLIDFDPKSELGRRPVQQPPSSDAKLSKGIAAKVAPWLNLAEFLQKSGGVKNAIVVKAIDEKQSHDCICTRRPWRYQWRKSVRRLDPLAQPFFGL